MDNPLTIIAIIIIFIILTWAIFAPLLTYIDFDKIAYGDFSTSPNQPPSSFHIFGTSKLGRDVYSRLIWGSRPSLTLSTIIVFISLTTGVTIGLFAGYYRGLLDSILMRVTDILFAFPSLIITILIVSVTDYNTNIVIIALGLLGFPVYARLVRGEVLKIRSSIFIEAARVSGCSSRRLLYRHIFPNIMSPVIISCSFNIGTTILSISGLRFLGFPLTDGADWGSDLAIAKMKIISAPWAAIVPGIGIFIAVLGFMLLGDGLRDAFDPRLSKK